MHTMFHSEAELIQHGDDDGIDNKAKTSIFGPLTSFSPEHPGALHQKKEVHSLKRCWSTDQWSEAEAGGGAAALLLRVLPCLPRQDGEEDPRSARQVRVALFFADRQKGESSLFFVDDVGVFNSNHLSPNVTFIGFRSDVCQPGYKLPQSQMSTLVSCDPNLSASLSLLKSAPDDMSSSNPEMCIPAYHEQDCPIVSCRARNDQFVQEKIPCSQARS